MVGDLEAEWGRGRGCVGRHSNLSRTPRCNMVSSTTPPPPLPSHTRNLQKFSQLLVRMQATLRKHLQRARVDCRARIRQALADEAKQAAAAVQVQVQGVEAMDVEAMDVEMQDQAMEVEGAATSASAAMEQPAAGALGQPASAAMEQPAAELMEQPASTSGAPAAAGALAGAAAQQAAGSRAPTAKRKRGKNRALPLEENVPGRGFVHVPTVREVLRIAHCLLDYTPRGRWEGEEPIASKADASAMLGLFPEATSSFISEACNACGGALAEPSAERTWRVLSVLNNERARLSKLKYKNTRPYRLVPLAKVRGRRGPVTGGQGGVAGSGAHSPHDLPPPTHTQIQPSPHILHSSHLRSTHPPRS